MFFRDLSHTLIFNAINAKLPSLFPFSQYSTHIIAQFTFQIVFREGNILSKSVHIDLVKYAKSIKQKME